MVFPKWSFDVNTSYFKDTTWATLRTFKVNMKWNVYFLFKLESCMKCIILKKGKSLSKKTMFLSSFSKPLFQSECNLVFRYDCNPLPFLDKNKQKLVISKYVKYQCWKRNPYLIWFTIVSILYYLIWAVGFDVIWLPT